MRKKLLPILNVIVLLPAVVWAAEPSAEEAAERREVRKAILDYVEGIYQVKPERIKRSVHPKLWKRGYGWRNGKYDEIPMTFDELVGLAGKYNKDGHIKEDAPKQIRIFEVLDKTASAKLTAEWGIDYFHLAKLDGKWMIMNVIWQTSPR